MGTWKKNYYSGVKKKSGKYSLEFKPGIKGFLITTSNEPKAVSEAYRLLNQYDEKIAGISTNNEIETKSIDPIDAVEIESNMLKESRQKFQSINTKCKNYIFINSNNPNIIKLTDCLFQDLLDKNTAHSRYCLRFYPVVSSSHCNLESIKKRFTDDIIPMINVMFKDHKTYDILIKLRNSSEKKQPIFNAIEDLLCENCPNLLRLNKNACVIFGVFVLRNVCFFSIMKDYDKYKKYNIGNLVEIHETDKIKINN